MTTVTTSGLRPPPGADEARTIGIRLAFLTDILSPYMVAVLEALNELLDLHVIFCSRSGTRGLAWQLDPAFRHEIVEGLMIPRDDATDFYLSPRIVAALHRARPQAIVSGGFSVPSVYAAGYGHVRGVPLLIHSDGTSRYESELGLHTRVSRAILRRLAWGAVANSEAAAARFNEIGFVGERIFRAPHTTQVEQFWPVADRRRPAGEGSFRLLFVGRLIPRKGCDWLLRACAAARADDVDVELTVVGTGPEETSLRRLAEALQVPVKWRGFVDQPKLPHLYEQADAFAFPTHNDPFGIVLLEAAAAGMPLIASPHAGATEDLVSDGVNGFIVEPTDTVAVAARISRLAREPDLRSRMGSAAQAVTRQRTAAHSAAGYADAVEAALASRP